MAKDIEEKANTTGEFLKKYWFIITAVVAMSAAWGETRTKVITLEDAVKTNAATQADVSDLKANAAAIDERTKAMQKTQEVIQDNQANQQKLLEQILLNMPKGKR